MSNVTEILFYIYILQSQFILDIPGVSKSIICNFMNTDELLSTFLVHTAAEQNLKCLYFYFITQVVYFNIAINILPDLLALLVHLLF